MICGCGHVAPAFPLFGRKAFCEICNEWKRVKGNVTLSDLFPHLNIPKDGWGLPDEPPF